MTDIFLSYNREDQARAKLFAGAFDAQGFKVWWDVGLRTGEAYDQVTEKALREAKAVVVLWSKKSVESRWVRAEATLAERNKTLVPCMIEPCERPIMFELTQTAELGHWQGDATDKAWLAFLADVRRLVAKEAARAAEAPAPTLTAPSVQETVKPGQSHSAPSLAVLPFTNRSRLPEDEVFAEGMVEDVISALTQGANVRVMGSTSTAHLRRSANTDLAALGRQLGVRYLLEGNVRRVGANLRVTTQLLEAATGEATWTAKFDRPLAELAELQEEMVTEIAASLDTQVLNLEMVRALKKPRDITGWEAAMRAASALRRTDSDAFQRAFQEATRAVTIAPEFALGHAILANVHAASYMNVGRDDPAEVQRIRDIADRALALAPDNAMVLGIVGVSLCWVDHPEEGVRHTERAVRKAPGSGMQHYYHSQACLMLNRLEESLSHANVAERLSPSSNFLWGVKLGQASALAGLAQWTEADAAIDQGIALNATYGPNFVLKALCCVQLGRKADASRQIEALHRLGYDLPQAEQLWRCNIKNNPRIESDLATIRYLYAVTEPGA